MTKRAFTTLIMITLTTAMMPLFTPTVFAQAGEATATFEITGCDAGCILTLTITSPVDVAEFQVAIKTSSTVNLAAPQATLTGFMAGSTHLSLKGIEIDEYRWFNLQSRGGKTGTLSIPVSNIGGEVAVYLERADLLDSDGNRIQVAGLPQGAILIITSTTTSTTTTTTTTTSTTRVTSTTTTTTTSTTTLTARVTTTTTSTTIRTSTRTTTQTTTSTSITTSTATSTTTTSTTQTMVATSTATTTTTMTTTEVVGVDTTWMAATAALAITALILLAMIIRARRQRA